MHATSTKACCLNVYTRAQLLEQGPPGHSRISKHAKEVSGVEVLEHHEHTRLHARVPPYLHAYLCVSASARPPPLVHLCAHFCVGCEFPLGCVPQARGFGSGHARALEAHTPKSTHGAQEERTRGACAAHMVRKSTHGAQEEHTRSACAAHMVRKSTHGA